MIKDIVTFKFGSFINYKGEEQLIIACAVSQKVEKGMSANWEYADDSFPIYRAINIGISVYNAEDTFSIEEGKQYAYNRAIANSPSLFVAEGDLINDEITNALLKQAITKFRPETVIPNYKEKAARYNTIMESKKFYDSLSSEDRVIVSKAIQYGTTNEMIEKCMPYINAKEQHHYN